MARNILREALFRDIPMRCAARARSNPLQRLTQKDLLDFRDRYLVAKNGVISVFGNVKAAEVKQLVRAGARQDESRARLRLTDAKPSTPLGKTGNRGKPERQGAGRDHGRLSRRELVQSGSIRAGIDR